MKKIFALLFAVIFIFSLSGCKTESEVFDFAPITLKYTVAQDDAVTEIILKPDGTFTGTFTDTAPELKEADYPSGTVYYCNFSGEFTEIELLDSTVYSMKLQGFKTRDTEGKSEIRDGIRYVSYRPLGFSEDAEYELYTPLANPSLLNEMFLFWWPQAASSPETLNCYAIRNTVTNEGFFSAPTNN